MTTSQTKYADALITDIQIDLGWPARLRVLLHGQISVRHVVETEHEVGRTRVRESCTVVPPVVPRSRVTEESTTLTSHPPTPTPE